MATTQEALLRLAGHHPLVDGTTLIREVVRSERPPTDLEVLGVRFTTGEQAQALDVPASLAEVVVPLSDLAIGLLRAVPTTGRRSWASLLLMLDTIQFDGDEEDRETLLEALWAVSADEAVHQDAVAVARRLTAG